MSPKWSVLPQLRAFWFVYLISCCAYYFVFIINLSHILVLFKLLVTDLLVQNVRPANSVKV